MPEPPTIIELAVGEEYTASMPSLRTAGYVWDYELAGEAGVISVEWSSPTLGGYPSRPIGVSAPEVLTIRATRPGAADVRLYQHRPWEPQRLAGAERRLSVLVRPD
jgi:predicted secreted protein